MLIKYIFFLKSLYYF